MSWSWEDLQYFLAVARTGQLSRAAHILGTSHVTIGRHIERLETAIGRRLFERKPKGYQLTPSGEKLRELVEQIDVDTARLPELLAGSSPDIGGTLRLNMPEGLCGFFCSHLLREFRVGFPALTLELAAIQQLASFTPNATDLSIVLDPPRASLYSSEKILDYSLHVYGAGRYLASHRQIRCREDLLDHDFIGYIDGMIFMPSLDYLFEVARGLRPVLQFSSIYSQMHAVRDGLGLAVLPDYIAQNQADLQPVLADVISLRRSYWLACRSELRAAPREQAVIETLLGSLRAHAGDLDRTAEGYGKLSRG